MQHTPRPPIVALLGYGGLIPFLTLAALTCLDRGRSGLWHGTLLAYGAIILTFVGALHWGIALVRDTIVGKRMNATYTWSVVPSLIGFAALAANSVIGDMMLVSGFLLHYWQDTRLAVVADLPAWYLPFRLRLTTVAIASIAAGAIVEIIF